MLVLWYSSWSSFFPFYNFPRRKSVGDARHESDRSRVTTKVTRTRHRRRTKAVKEWVNNGFFVLNINIQIVPHRKPTNYLSNYPFFFTSQETSDRELAGSSQEAAASPSQRKKWWNKKVNQTNSLNLLLCSNLYFVVKGSCFVLGLVPLPCAEGCFGVRRHSYFFDSLN